MRTLSVISKPHETYFYLDEKKATTGLGKFDSTPALTNTG